MQTRLHSISTTSLKFACYAVSICAFDPAPKVLAAAPNWLLPTPGIAPKAEMAVPPLSRGLVAHLADTVVVVVVASKHGSYPRGGLADAAYSP